jgi:hypothetical protein
MSTALDEALSDLLCEGSMELVEPAGRQRKRSIDAMEIPPADQLPIVSIGRPRAWTIDELVLQEDLPTEMKASLKTEMFFVLRLACSFRPQRDEVRIAWAQLTLQLKPDQQGLLPLAFDLYPMSVDRERKTSKRISLSPSLKFYDVEAGLGEFAYSVDYPAIEPVLTATGIEEETPSWNFTAVSGFPLTGSKLLYAVVAAPRALNRLAVALALTADLDYKRRRFSAWLRGGHGRAHPPISEVLLWP